MLVERPEQWPWSSYAGYVDASRRLPWIDYDTLLNAWQGTVGGASPEETYHQYVEAGLSEPIASPFEQAMDGWILGSTSFAERMRELVLPEARRPSAGTQRRRVSVTQEQIVQTVCNVCEVDPVVLSTRGSRHPARALVAYLCRCATDKTLAQIQALRLVTPSSPRNV